MKTNVIRSDWLSRDGIRLGAQYHASAGPLALRNLDLAKAETEELQAVCETIYIPSRFKRPYVSDPKFGLPYITGATLVLAYPKDSGVYLSQTLTPNLDQLVLRRGMILTTCSGTIGKSVLVNADLEGCVGSPDLLRIVPDPAQISLGYLFAYLSSDIGQSLIGMQTYGSVVDHIEAHHLYKLPIPRLGDDLEASIHEKVVRAWTNREEANSSLREAQSLLCNALNLIPLRVLHTSEKTFSLSSTELDLRLDASYYHPLGREAVRILEERDDCCLLGDKDVTHHIFHPFRMNMVLVDREHGVPFLGGGDVVQYRYFGDKYISQVTDGYEGFLLGRSWTLMTIGGTIGRVSFVGDYLEGWAASQHVTRISPNETNLLPGYLNAYMECDYAQQQVKNLIYGSVIDTIRESQLGGLRIPIPSTAVQQPIHDLVEEAYRLRYEANLLEDEAQSLLMQALGLAENE